MIKRKILQASSFIALFRLLAHSSLAVEPVETQRLASADAVPEGLTASDWTSIRTVYQAQRHQVVPVTSGYRAHNPEQRWQTEFDGRGFTTRPDVGGWQWGLELKSYGFAANRRVVNGESEVKTVGNRVTYLRAATLREWFVNGSGGLEHGFTLDQPPDRAGEREETDLEFDFVVRGDLRPEISAGGVTLRFVDAQRETVLTYSGLKAMGCGWQETASPFRRVARRRAPERRGERRPISYNRRSDRTASLSESVQLPAQRRFRCFHSSFWRHCHRRGTVGGK